MPLIALVDADQLIHRYALKFDTNYPAVLTQNLDLDIATLLTDCGCTHHRIFVGSYEPTFRKAIDINYKDNRPKTPHKNVFRNHLVEQWGAIQCIGYEVDDALAMEANNETILVHDDKDILQVAGRHFIPKLWRMGAEVRPNEFKTIDEWQGLVNVYSQSLIGDMTDNVIGIKGIGKAGAAKKLKDCQSELDLYQTCKEIYKDDDRFHMNMNMLWLWRKFGENYTKRIEIRQWSGL